MSSPLTCPYCGKRIYWFQFKHEIDGKLFHLFGQNCARNYCAHKMQEAVNGICAALEKMAMCEERDNEANNRAV